MGERDAELRERAQRVVPGGMYGHMSVRPLPAGYPQFFERGDGCRVVDADGREYVDFMCSYGPIVLGHRHPAVEEAAARQLARGDCMVGPAPVLVELAELLVDTVAAADWALFQKNGGDATSLCVQIARAATGRRKVLVARGAYHGSLPWCTPFPTGVTEEDRAHVRQYDYNDVASLEEAADGAGDDLAAVMVSAHKHDAFVDQELPSQEFASAARRVCDRRGAALVLDDVRAGFRLDVRGSWEPLGVRPDLTALGKALGNGWPVAAVTGCDALRSGAKRVFATGSYWFGAAPMAAAIATVRALREGDALPRMERAGRLLREGLEAQARHHGLGLRQSGPVQMPLLLFDDDPQLHTGNRFVLEALRRGVYLHPWHNMFMCAAHDPDDVKRALERTDEAFAAVARGS